MRLDQALVQRNLCESRTEAQELITGGKVILDGQVCTKQTRQVSETVHIEVTAKRKFVSRGGDKLEGAIIHVFGTQKVAKDYFLTKRAIDIGSSTGGFTDCLLSYGVHDVTAIDVGTSQFHHSLKNNINITLFENTDIRTFTADRTFDIVVADVSFISLEKIFDRILSFGHITSSFFLLIKPQFEVGKGNTKKGIVRDQTLLSTILNDYELLAKSKGMTSVSIFPCHIQGGDGNQEFFLYGTLS